MRSRFSERGGSTEDGPPDVAVDLEHRQHFNGRYRDLALITRLPLGFYALLGLYAARAMHRMGTVQGPWLPSVGTT
jgi:hypothetical protein